jgi:hypothetical protein
MDKKKARRRPFENAYWDHDEPGIYVDIVSGEPLFSSLDKHKAISERRDASRVSFGSVLLGDLELLRREARDGLCASRLIRHIRTSTNAWLDSTAAVTDG